MRHGGRRVRATLTMVTDAELLAHVRDGDEGAFVELYRRHVDAARSAARCLLRSRSEVDDVVADSFTRVLSILQRGGGPEEAFRPYLLTCVRHACYDRTDGDVHTPSPLDPGDVSDLLNAEHRGHSDTQDGLAESDLVARAFASLPERWQHVLWSTEVDGRRPAELASELDLAPGAVAALVYRAREGLTEAYLAAHLQHTAQSGCTTARPHLAAYVRNNIGARDRAEVEEHLVSCPDCRALTRELEQLNRPLRSVLVPAVVGVSSAAYLGGLSGGLLPRIGRVVQASPRVVGSVAAGAALVVGATVVGVTRLPPARHDAPTVVVAEPPASASGVGSAGAGAPSTTTGTLVAGGRLGPSGVSGAVPAATTTTVGAAIPGGPSGSGSGGTPGGGPGGTVPAVTVPGITVPGITVPTVTVPTVSVPAVTLPPVTLPPLTLPPVTLPPITIPAVTLPPVTAAATVALNVQTNLLGLAVPGLTAQLGVTVRAVAGGGGNALPTRAAVTPTVRLSLGAGLTFASASGGWACTGTTTVVCQAPMLATGQSSTATITVHVALTALGVLHVTPSVSGAGQTVVGAVLDLPIHLA